MNDLRYAVRLLLRNPGFTLVAVCVLALGIGANTAMFSLVNALMLRPLAVKQPDALVGVYSKDRKPEGGFRAFSYPNYVELRDRNDVFESLMAHNVTMVGLTDGEVTRRGFAATVSANYFRTFGVRPILGRDFLPEEERPGSQVAVAILSYGAWQRSGGDPGIVGSSLRVNGRAFSVVGVAPRSFSGTAVLFSPDLWVPLGVYESLANDFANDKNRRLDERGHHCLLLVGRLAPGITREVAEARLRPLMEQLEKGYPAENKDQTLVLASLPRTAISTNPQSGGPMGALSVLLMSMSGVVLLIACLNLANMLLARAAARRKEIAVRLALGGARHRLVRQLFTEGLLLALVGGATGMLLAQVAVKVLVASLASKLPFAALVFPSVLDFRVLAATGAFCVLATLLFSLGPALRATRCDLLSDLKAQAGETSGVRPGAKLWAPRNLLVTGQVALSLVLVVSAGLFTRGALNAMSADPGFRFEQGLLVEMDASLAGYEQAKSRPLYLAALERVRALPGVQAASLASMVPFGMFTDDRRVQRLEAVGKTNAAPAAPRAEGESSTYGFNGAPPDRASPDPDQPVASIYTIVGTDYFKSLGLPLLRGREFERLEAEAGTGSRVAVIDEPLARRLWPGQDPLGRWVTFTEFGGEASSKAMQVVGVVPAVRNDLVEKEAQPHVYVPFGQANQSMMNLHVRTSGRGREAELSVLRSVRQTLRQLDDRLPVLAANRLSDFHNEGLLMWFMNTGARMFALLGGVAVFLAVVGVYGVKAYVVAQRTREIGIRMALGATKQQVVWLVLRDGLRLTLVGVVTGLLLALGAGQLLSSRLYEVSGSDPLTFVVATLLLTAAALVACWLPARRAARVAPMTALRYE